MTLNRIKLGKYIKLCDEKNSDEELSIESVRGISTQKRFIETKADMDGVSLRNYKIVRPNCFAYVPDTSRRGDKISLAYNDTNKSYLVSSISVVFCIDNEQLDSEYLFIYFNRPEFDRYSRFNSWGSAREAFSWQEMCDIELELPSIEIQRKYVAIYKAMLENQKNYEIGLDDLKLVCDAYIENLRRKFISEEIGLYINLYNKKVKDANKEYTVHNIAGISSVEKKFIETKADTNGLLVDNYNIVPKEFFAFNPNTARMGDKIPIALNDTDNDVIVSAIYPVFCCKMDKLIPEYLAMFFLRSEFDRYARFHSWGSARETFNWNDMMRVKVFDI